MATWYQYQIEVGQKYDGASFTDSSVWGNGSNGTNLWGWGSNNVPMEIDGPFNSDGKVLILVKLNFPGGHDCTELALVSRVKLADEKHAVFAHLDRKG